jgi:NADH:ubiquinone oxidoreductase subunit E
MEKIVIQICGGTTCRVMGGDHLFDLEEHLPEDVRAHVRVEGAHCLGFCSARNGAARPPYAAIDGEPVADATISGLVEELTRRVRKAG